MRRTVVIAVLCLAAACGDGGGPGDPEGLIEVFGTSEFSGTPLDTLPELLTVLVIDQDQRPLGGVPVTWTTANGGSLIPESRSTDANGMARARWVLGWRPGAQQATASISGSDVPAVFSAAAEGFQARTLATGDGYHQCGIDTGGTLFCWGPNDDGQLGDGTTSPSDTPVAALLSGPVSQAVTGYSALQGDFTCALTLAGVVYCWGANDSGQLGNGNSSPSAIPVQVQLPSTPIKALSVRDAGVCALSSTGEVYCWGHERFGRLGTGITDGTVSTPALLPGNLHWRQVALGDDRACGIAEAGQVYCWGAQPDWLGTGVDTNTIAPLPVTNAPILDSLTISGWHQCGITAEHVTYCWGANRNIGFNDSRNVIPDPTALATSPPFRSLHSSYDPTFGLGLDGVGYWWGPPHGATGGPPVTPQPFSGEIPLTALGITESGVCGIEASTGTVYCWSSFTWDGPERLVAVPKAASNP